MLLRGLAELRPAGTWVLWGDGRRLAEYCWAGAIVEDDRHDPAQWAGQRGRRHHPAGRVLCALHQIRPLGLNIPVLQLFHDTIPIRTARKVSVRVAKRAYLRAVARGAYAILTPSQWSRSTVVADLGLDPDAISVLHYPVDEDFVARVAGLRPCDEASYLLCAPGRPAPHKNLDRLIEAFARSEYASRAGRLVVLASVALRGGTCVRSAERRRHVQWRCCPGQGLPRARRVARDGRPLSGDARRR